MRFGVGGTVEEYMSRASPREQRGWANHFRRFPPGDFYAQTLLARLCAMVASIGTGQQVSPAEFAPWIDWGGGKKSAEEKQRATELAALEAIMEAQHG